MKTNTSLGGGPYLDREHIKGTPIAAKRAELVCELSRLEDHGMAGSAKAAELRAQIAILTELIQEER